MYKVIFVLLAMAFTPTVFAKQFVYPASGQSAEQQQKDEEECSAWATENSADVSSESQTEKEVSTQQKKPSGARLRGAARGALIGEVADGDTGDAAAVGAVMGGSRERRANRKSKKQSEATAETAQNTDLADYDKARAACLEGKGYTVK